MLRLALFSLMMTVLGCATDTQPTAEPAPAAPAVDAQSRTGQGLDVRQVNAPGLLEDLKELDAELVIVNVWATWCGPCRVEFPEFVRFGQDNVGTGVAVRFLSVDDQGAVPQMGAFLERHGVTDRSYLSATGSNIVATLSAPRRWNYGIPATMIFNGDGELVDFWEGAVTYDFLQAKVQQLLASPNEQTASR